MNAKFTDTKPMPTATREIVKVWEYIPYSARLLAKQLANYNVNVLTAAIDAGTDGLDNINNDFVRIVKWHINGSTAYLLVMS